MARDFNQNRIANARLIQKNIDFFGKRWAIQDNADGYSIVNVEVPAVPDDIKAFLEGDGNVTVFPIPSNINKLCEYALASFPNIETIYLFKNTSIVVLDDDLSYLTYLTKIYVPTDLLSAYQSAYPTLSSKFDTILTDYTLTIEPLQEETVLTAQYLNEVIGMLSSAEKQAITKVLISTDFTTYYEAVWAYDFSELTSLNDNIWYGSTLIKFDEYIIQGNGELTAGIVETQYNNISVDKYISDITKVIVPLSFTSYVSGSINKIKQLFSDMTILTTTYTDGEMDIEIGGDIEQQIINKNLNLDDALVYARYLSINKYAQPIYNDINAIIIPPMKVKTNWSNPSSFSGCENIVYVANAIVSTFSSREIFSNNGCKDAIKILLSTEGVVIFNRPLAGLKTTYLKEFVARYSYGSANYIGGIDPFSNAPNLEKLILEGNVESVYMPNSPKMTRQALVDLINSLGNPSTQKTLTIGATNLAKLTADDIAIATAKNWVVQ